MMIKVIINSNDIIPLMAIILLMMLVLIVIITLHFQFLSNSVY